MQVNFILSIVQLLIWKVGASHLTNLDLYYMQDSNDEYLRMIEKSVQVINKPFHINTVYKEIRGQNLPFFDMRYSYTGNWTGETTKPQLNKFKNNSGYMTQRLISTTLNESCKQS